MRTRDKFISVCLTDEEAKNLRLYANQCGLTQSALMRMLIQGKLPKPNPPPVFWEMLNELYSIHNSFRIIADSVVDIEISENARERQKEIVNFLLWLQAAVTLPAKVVIQHGDNKAMGD